MGHIGLLPQSVRSEGGYKVKGRDEKSFEQVIEDAKAIESAGAFAIVVEGVTPDLGAVITQSVDIPVIGIGAGADTDGQVLVWSDMFGFFEDFKPKFVRQYINGASIVRDAVSSYKNDVENLTFPNESEKY